MNSIDGFGDSVVLSSLEYKECNKSNPITLFFIHGSGSTKATWDVVIEPLKLLYNIVAIDLRGHGDSPLGNANFSITQMVEDVEQVVKNKKLDKFIIIAHSMGIRVAVPYSAKHPEQVQALVLEDLDVLPIPKNIFPEDHIEHLKAFKAMHANEEEARQELIKMALEIDLTIGS